MKRLIFQELKKPEQILSRFEVCSTDSIEIASQWGEKILCKNELSAVHDKASHSILNTSIYYRQLSNVGFGRMSYGGDVVIRPQGFEDFVFIQIPVTGEERVVLDDSFIISTPDSGLIINRHANSLFNHSAGTEKLFLRIQQETIDLHCQKILGRTLSESVHFNPILDFHTPQGMQWIRMMSSHYDFLSEDWPVNPLIAAQIENNVISTLLLSQSHNYSELIFSETPNLTPYFIKRVEQYIEDNAHLPISIADMAEYAGVSARTLFSGFNRYRDTTPMRYLKDVRLQHVHEELSRSHNVMDSVTDIALKWGFTHLGHFGSDYRKRFGETPSTTLKRTRL